MNAAQIIVNILMILSSIVMIVTVMLQSSESDGMGAISGGSETFFGKNKNSTFEGKMAMGTKVSASVFVVLALIMLFIS